jgi:hypothetical protein
MIFGEGVLFVGGGKFWLQPAAGNGSPIGPL